MGHSEDIQEAKQWLEKNEARVEELPSLDPHGTLGGPGSERQRAATPGGESAVASSAPAIAAQGETGGEIMGAATDSPSYTKALEALHRGLPKAIREKTISAMSPEEILEVGMQMANAQAEQDKLGAELGRLKEAKDTPAAKKGEDSGGDTAPAEPSPKAEALDLSSVLEPFDLDLESEDLPKALTAVAQHVNALADARFQNERKALRMELGELRGALNEMRGEAVGRQLEGRFPQLREPSILSDVLKRAEQYAHIKDFEYTPGASAAQKFRERVELAAEVVLGRRAAQGNSPPVERAQPPVPSRPTVSKANGQRNSIDRAQAWIDTYEATGGDRAAADRAYRG